jgi:hypothetical protein
MKNETLKSESTKNVSLANFFSGFAKLTWKSTESEDEEEEKDEQKAGPEPTWSEIQNMKEISNYIHPLKRNKR